MAFGKLSPPASVEDPLRTPRPPLFSCGSARRVDEHQALVAGASGNDRKKPLVGPLDRATLIRPGAARARPRGG